MGEATGRNKGINERFGIIVDRAKSVGAMVRSRAEALRGDVETSIQDTLPGRKEEVSVRVDKRMLTRLDQLVEADLVSSRSDASEFLMAKGVSAERELFERIGKIRDVKQELREFLNDPPKRKVEEPGIGHQNGTVATSTRSWRALFSGFRLQLRRRGTF